MVTKLHTFTIHNYLEKIKFSNSGKYLLAQIPNQIIVWNIKTGVIENRINVNAENEKYSHLGWFALLSDNETLILGWKKSTYEYQSIHFFNLNSKRITKKLMCKILGYNNEISALFLPQDEQTLVGVGDYGFYFWKNSIFYPFIGKYPKFVNKNFQHSVFSVNQFLGRKNGNYVINSSNGYIDIVNIKEKYVIFNLHSNTPVDLSPDGTLLTYSKNKSIYIYDLKTSKERFVLSFGGQKEYPQLAFIKLLSDKNKLFFLEKVDSYIHLKIFNLVEKTLIKNYRLFQYAGHGFGEIFNVSIKFSFTPNFEYFAYAIDGKITILKLEI